MISKSLLKVKFVFITWAVIATACLGLVFIADHQAGNFNRNFRPNAQIAVFLAPESKVSPEVLKEKFINMDGVASAEFVSKEKVLERAQNEGSPVKSLVLSGENPFSPYFIVLPVKVEVSFAKRFAEAAGKIDGVAEVGFDENLFRAVEKTGYLADFYKRSGYLIVILSLILIIVKFIFRWLNEEAEFLNYIFNIATGILTGIAGAGLFYLITRKLLHADILALPIKYAPFFIAGGILIILLGENDQR